MIRLKSGCLQLLEGKGRQSVARTWREKKRTFDIVFVAKVFSHGLGNVEVIIAVSHSI